MKKFVSSVVLVLLLGTAITQNPIGMATAQNPIGMATAQNPIAVSWTPCGVSLYTIGGNTLDGIWAGCENTKTGKETLTRR